MIFSSLYDPTEREGTEAVVDRPLLVILQNFEIQNDPYAAFSGSFTQGVLLTVDKFGNFLGW